MVAASGLSPGVGDRAGDACRSRTNRLPAVRHGGDVAAPGVAGFPSAGREIRAHGTHVRADGDRAVSGLAQEGGISQFLDVLRHWG